MLCRFIILQTEKNVHIPSVTFFILVLNDMLNAGNTKGGSITVLLTCLTGLESAPRTFPERNNPERKNPNLFSRIYVIIPKI